MSECLLALVHVGRTSVHTGQNAQGVVRALETMVGDREAAREAQDKRRGRRVLTSWRNKKEMSINSLIVRRKGPFRDAEN